MSVNVFETTSEHWQTIKAGRGYGNSGESKALWDKIMKVGLVGILALYALCSCWSWTKAISTEEELVGRKLTTHPILKDFQQFLESPLVASLHAVLGLNDYMIHHTVLDYFCSVKTKSSDGYLDDFILGNCRYSEYYACLESLRKPFEKRFDSFPAQVEPKEIIGSWYDHVDSEGKRSTCKRISNPSVEEFMSYVASSEPVIITDVATKWKAMTSNKWTWKYLLEKLGNQQVVVSVSPNPYFDGPEAATYWNISLDSGEKYVVARPAQLHVTFKEFHALLHSNYNNEETFFYMQYMPIKLFDNEGQGTEASPTETLLQDIPPIEESFAQFLFPQLQLLWIGDGRNKGWVHNDKQENLMAVLSGKKTFRLIPPLPAQRPLLYGNQPMRGGNLLYKFLDERDESTGLPKAKFFRNKELLSEINHFQSYSAVRLDNPNYEEFPASRKINVVECEVNEGEILFNPGHWWHEVDSGGDDEKKSIGLNWFFAPLYNHILSNDTVWKPNRFYFPLAPKLSAAIEKHHPRPSQFTVDLSSVLKGTGSLLEQIDGKASAEHARHQEAKSEL